MLVKEYKERLRQKIFDLLGIKCVVCGESDWRCLQIDHVHGGGNEERKKLCHGTHGSNQTYYREILKKIKGGSKDYQILCANCNWKKKYEEGKIKRWKYE